MASMIEDGMHGTKKQQISIKTIIACGKLLDAHLTMIEDNLWEYADGWDDKRIAEETKLKPAQVAHIRKAEKGNLYFRPKTPQLPGLDTRFSEMQSRILILEQDVTTLQGANKNLNERVAQLEHDLTQLKLSTKFKVVG